MSAQLTLGAEVGGSPPSTRTGDAATGAADVPESSPAAALNADPLTLALTHGFKDKGKAEFAAGFWERRGIAVDVVKRESKWTVVEAGQ